MQAEVSVRTYSKNDALVQERRQHIMRCAIRVFLQRGYRGTTTRELARACGMSEGAMYRYIGSKDDILHLICMERAHGADFLEAHLEQLGDVSAEEALRACLALCFKWADSTRDYNLFFNREINHFSREDRGTLLEDQTAMVHFFEKLLVRGIQAGEFQMESPIVVAHDILMKVHDWGLRRWFLRQYVTLEDYARMQVDIVLRSIRTDTLSPHVAELAGT